MDSIHSLTDIEKRINQAKGILSKLRDRRIFTRPNCWIFIPKSWNIENISNLLLALGPVKFASCSDGSGDIYIVGGGRISFYQECPQCHQELKRRDVDGKLPQDELEFTCYQCKNVFKFMSGQLTLVKNT